MGVLRLFFDNPVFKREWRRRLRGRAMIVTLLGYIAAMCLIAFFVIQSETNAFERQNQYQGSGAGMIISDIGRSVWRVILYIQAFLVFVVAPGITGSMVRSEKERETFDFLRATAITAPTYVVGAILSTVMYVALALLCSMPVLSVAYLYGGVSELPEATTLMFFISLFLSSLGLLLSASSAPRQTAASARGGGGPAFVLGVLGLWMFWLVQEISSTGLMRPVGPMPSVPQWMFLSGCLACLAGVALLAAARKLFRPGERALSYKQYGLVATAIVAVVMAFGVMGRSRNAMPAFSEAGAVFGVILMLAAGGLVTFLPARVEPGNERWSLQQRYALWRKVNDAAVMSVAIVIAGVGVSAGYMVLDGTMNSMNVLALTPIVGFLLWAAMLTYWLSRRSATAAQASQQAMLLLVSVIMFPLLFLPLSGPSGYAWADLFVAFSPVYGAWSFIATGSAACGLSAALYMGLAALFWMMSRRLPAAESDAVLQEA